MKSPPKSIELRNEETKEKTIKNQLKKHGENQQKQKGREQETRINMTKKVINSDRKASGNTKLAYRTDELTKQEFDLMKLNSRYTTFVETTDLGKGCGFY